MENLKTTARLLCLIGFLDLMAVSMILPLLATRSRHLGASPLLIGLIGSIYGAVQLFSSPVIGSWSDIKGRKFTLIFSLLASAFSYFIIGCNSLLVLLIISRFLSGFFKHSQSLAQAYLANIVPPDERAIFYGYFTASGNIGFIVGPTCGGHLAELPNGFFLVAAAASIIFVLNAIIAWKFLPKLEPHINDDSLKKDRGLKEALHSTVFHTSFKNFGVNYFSRFQLVDCWDIMLLRFVLSFSTLVFRSNFSLVLEEKYGFTPIYVGYVTSFQGGISTVAGFLVGYLTLIDTDKNRQAFVGILTLFLALLGVTVSSTISVLLGSLIVLCISTSFLRVCVTDMLTCRCSKDKIGAVFGFGQSVTSLGRMLAPLIGGLAFEMGPHGPGLVGTVFAGIGLVCSGLFLQTPKQKIN